MNERELLQECRERLADILQAESASPLLRKTLEKIDTFLSTPAPAQAEVGELVKDMLWASDRSPWARNLLRQAAACLTRLAEEQEKNSVLIDAARSALNVLVGVSDQTLATDIETAIRQLTDALAAQSGKEGK